MPSSRRLKIVFLMLALLVCSYEIVDAHAQQCYACEQNNCDKFDPSNSTFIKDCPSAVSCSIQTYGGNVIRRSCENVKLEDCQTANNIRYCYCIQNLCNGKMINNFNNDDEDLAEGSGANFGKNRDYETTTHRPSSQSSFIHFYSCTIYIFLYIAVFCY